jgi:hypothetical protein
MGALSRALFPATLAIITFAITLSASTFLLFKLLTLEIFLDRGLGWVKEILANPEISERCERQKCEWIGSDCVWGAF